MWVEEVYFKESPQQLCNTLICQRHNEVTMMSLLPFNYYNKDHSSAHSQRSTVMLARSLVLKDSSRWPCFSSKSKPVLFTVCCIVWSVFQQYLIYSVQIKLYTSVECIDLKLRCSLIVLSSMNNQSLGHLFIPFVRVNTVLCQCCRLCLCQEHRSGQGTFKQVT